jgi:S1-C subfamily serine protease
MSKQAFWGKLGLVVLSVLILLFCGSILSWSGLATVSQHIDIAPAVQQPSSAPEVVAAPTVPEIQCVAVDKRVPQMWAPTVRVRWEDAKAQAGSLGSGVVFGRIGTYVYVLTANHVVETPTSQVIITPCEDGSVQVEIAPVTLAPQYYVDFGVPGGLQEIAVPAKIVATSPKYDLAIIRFDYGTQIFPTAILSGRGEYCPQILDDVWSAGYQLGRKAVLTQGQLVVERWDILNDGLEFMETTASIMPGSSGGPVFAMINGDYKVIGVQLRWGGAPHLALSLPIKYFWTWYDEAKLAEVLCAP